MISFLIGCLVSLVAAFPAILLARGGKDSAPGARFKLWGLGVAIRFAIIGVSLICLFTQTEIARIPALFGVVTVYFLIFLVESRTTLRH